MSLTTVRITQDLDGCIRIELSNMGGLSQACWGDSTMNKQTATLFAAIMAISGVTDVSTQIDNAHRCTIIVRWCGGYEAAAFALGRALWPHVVRAVKSVRRERVFWLVRAPTPPPLSL